MDLYKNKDFNPMLLSEDNTPFNNKSYLYELKFDGIRALIFVDPNHILIKSRNNQILNDVFPELLHLKKHVKNKCIFDGEIVATIDEKPSFLRLQERLHLKSKRQIDILKKSSPVTFICFDILYENKNKHPRYPSNEVFGLTARSNHCILS